MKKFVILCTAAAVGAMGIAAPAQAQRMVPREYSVPTALKEPENTEKEARAALKAMDEAVDEALTALALCNRVGFLDAKAKLDKALKSLKKNTKKPPKPGPRDDPRGIDAYIDEYKATLERAYKAGKEKPEEISGFDRRERYFPAPGTDMAIVLERIARLRFLTDEWIRKYDDRRPCPKREFDRRKFALGEKRTAAERAKDLRPETASERGARERRENTKKDLDGLPEPGDKGLPLPPPGEGG
ncbi:MAG: hypothetical protein AAF687_01840 [Pseudomonadota bacterium]